MRGRAVRALIVDDHEDMRGLVRMVFEMADDIEVVGEADSAEAGRRRWAELRPDVVVVDYQLPEANGLDLAEWILAQDPGADILLFSAYIDEATAERAQRVGVRELIAKDRFRELPGLVTAHGAPTGA
jgi:two-component system invasion response regulator UvrY